MIKYGLMTVTSGYKRQLETHPLRTKMATSAFLFSLGDFLCQKTEAAYKCRCQQLKKTSSNESEKMNGSIFSMLTRDWDKSRTMRQGMIGGLMLSPGLHFFLTRVMTRCVLPSYSKIANIGLRVAVHQACMMPFI